MEIFKQTLLHTAVKESCVETVNSLLDQGTLSINGVDPFGKTPLHWAVEKKCKPIVYMLVARGADINVKDKLGNTPLHTAITPNSKPLVEFLLDSGADINVKDTRGMTPLNIAIFWESEPLVESLLARGADVNVKDTRGMTPLHYAVTKESVPLVQVLLARGADVNVRDYYNETPFSKAPESFFELLLTSGADVKNIDSHPSFWNQLLIKLKCANFDIGFDNRASCFNISDYRFYVTCLEEVKRLKLHIFNGCSLYAIFSKRSDPTFLKNKEMELAIRSDNLTTQFPIFGNLLSAEFKKAENRCNLLNSAQLVLEISLPNEMKRLIPSYLDCTDLLNLVKACQNVVCDVKVV